MREGGMGERAWQKTMLLRVRLAESERTVASRPGRQRWLVGGRILAGSTFGV